MMMRGSSRSRSSSRCQDCGNQAKRDCAYMRCRTCCKGKGFECQTHIKSTWLPSSSSSASYGGIGRAQKQTLSLLHHNHHHHDLQLLPSSVHQQNPRWLSEIPSTGLDDEGENMGRNFPAEATFPALLRRIRVSSMDDSINQFAYQTSVQCYKTRRNPAGIRPESGNFGLNVSSFQKPVANTHCLFLYCLQFFSFSSSSSIGHDSRASILPSLRFLRFRFSFLRPCPVMSNRIPCKFFAHGACLKGEHCDFAHDWKNPSNNICTFYQRGLCSYGSRCRYEHVRPSRPQPSASSSNSRQSVASESISLAHTATSGLLPLPGSPAELSALSKPFFPPVKPSRKLVSEHRDVLGPRITRPADLSICSFAAAGNCPRGEQCPHIHGDLCPICGKHCLHPFRADKKEEHLKTCEKKQKQLKALKDSQEIECSVCLDRVLSKATAAERKFGLLSECDHPFCISCIRNWRGSSPTSGMNVNTALRACPICRKVSYFVVPSVIWYSSKEEKQEIVDNYKAKLRSIDCKHFEFGNGNCPFGTSCFYKHTVKPGSYTWIHHRPPPSRRRTRRPNFRDMDALLNMIDLYMFESLREENEEELESLDPEDFYDDDDDLTAEESAFLLAQLGIGTDYSSNEET